MSDQKLLIVTADEYDDYHIEAVIEWISPYTPEYALETWLVLHPEQALSHNEQGGGAKFKDSAFVSWLITEGYARAIQAEELNLTDYSGIRKGWTREPIVRRTDEEVA